MASKAAIEMSKIMMSDLIVSQGRKERGLPEINTVLIPARYEF